MDNFLEKLKKYFSETPKQEIKRQWEKSVKWDEVGISVTDFIKHSQNRFYIESAEEFQNNVSTVSIEHSPKFNSGFFISYF